jgi:hypothetical protein
MPSEPAGAPAGGSESPPASAPARREDTEPAVLPVSQGPRIAMGIAGALILLLLGIWLGSILK